MPLGQGANAPLLQYPHAGLLQDMEEVGPDPTPDRRKAIRCGIRPLY